MKNFLKKIVLFLGIITAFSATTSLVSTPSTFADDTRMDGTSCATTSFAGLTPWDCGITKIDSEDSLTSNIATIATNILTDLSVIAAYLVLGYVIYGGYLYMFSSGDPGKAAAGKKTLTQAFIGLAIVLSAYTIFSAIRIALVGGQSLECDPLTGSGCMDDGGAMVTNLIQWVVGIGGAVAAIFIVVGAFGYITANGDPNKLQKAKTTILYALIGLIIVALAEVLTAFVANLVRESNADPKGFIKDTSITKEIANINKEE